MAYTRKRRKNNKTMRRKNKKLTRKKRIKRKGGLSAPTVFRDLKKRLKQYKDKKNLEKVATAELAREILDNLKKRPGELKRTATFNRHQNKR